jgi:hypothetical protein
MFRLFIVALLLLGWTVSGSSEEVYRWVDENGVVHYSDRPHPSAETITIQNSPTPPSGPVSQARSGSEGESERGIAPPPARFAYQTLDIQAPVQGETLWNIGDQLEVVLNVEPELQPGHTFRLYLDAAWLQDLPGRSNRLRLSEVFRGAHTLQAEIRDRNGVLQTQSPLVSIMVRQTSVINRPAGGN